VINLPSPENSKAAKIAKEIMATLATLVDPAVPMLESLLTCTEQGKDVLPVAATSLPAVRVTVTPGNLALVDPAVPMLEVLTCTEYEFEQGGPQGYRRVEREVSLATEDFRGRLVFPAGLLSRARAALEEGGFAVDVDDRRVFKKRSRADEEVIQAAGEDDRRLMEALAFEPLGQVEVRGFRDAVEKVALMRRLFPRARVVVAAASRREVWKLWRALEEKLKEGVGRLYSGTRKGGKRSLVSTYQHLQVAAPEADVLVLCDAHRALGNVAVEAVAGSGIRWVYGLVSRSSKVDQRTSLHLEGLCGPVIYRADPPAATVRVVMVADAALSQGELYGGAGEEAEGILGEQVPQPACRRRGHGRP
jgi:hypothetical protein